MDLLIPTCQRDLPQVRLLLRSLDTFVDCDVVSSLNLISIDKPEFFSQVQQLATYKFQSRTRYLTPTDLGLREGISDYRQGWKLQQAAKLNFARYTRSEFYMVLDSKNIALRPVRPGDLIEQGRAALMPEAVSFHVKWYRGSAWALAHRGFDCAPERRAISSATPVTFHARTVANMLDWLERHHGESIERFLERRRPIRHRFMRPTEFTLYYVYLDREGLLDHYHILSERLHDRASQIWASLSPSESGERLRRILNRQTTGLFTAMHPGPWEALTESDRSELMALAAGS
jgi:Family of unknown function (DUF6492)